MAEPEDDWLTEIQALMRRLPRESDVAWKARAEEFARRVELVTNSIPPLNALLRFLQMRPALSEKEAEWLLDHFIKKVREPEDYPLSRVQDILGQEHCSIAERGREAILGYVAERLAHCAS